MMFCTTSSTASSIEFARSFLKEHDQIEIDIPLHESRPVMGSAFGGASIEQSDQTARFVVSSFLDDNDNEARQEVAGLCLGFFMFETLHKGGLAFGIKDKHNGNLRSLVVFRQYNPSKEDVKNSNIFQRFCKTIMEFRAYWTMRNDPVGIPSVLKKSDNMKKLEAASASIDSLLEETFRKWHIVYGPKQPHLYVAIVATTPESQGKGYGLRAMNLLGEIADNLEMACYLECSKKICNFYEKCGFMLTKSFVDSNLDLGISAMETNICLMTRHPKPREHFKKGAIESMDKPRIHSEA